MKDVELTLNNYTKCLCPVCPVQEPSNCIAAKREGWRGARKSAGRVLRQFAEHPEVYDLEFAALASSETGRSAGFREPAPEEMTELYCSKPVGKSDCDDLNVQARCQCPDCAVWASHQLGGYYYCTSGSS